MRCFLFYQLLLPVCNPSKSGIDGDPRSPYYIDIERFTNMSKAQPGFGGSYGHNWRVVNASELVRFDGVIVRDGVVGSTNGAIYQRFQMGGCCYCKEIDDVMTASRYG